MLLHRRRHRRLLAWLLVACTLFAQSVALAYACDRAVGQAPVATIEAPLPCPSHLDGAQPAPEGNACKVHCQPSSLHQLALPDLSPGAAPPAWSLPLVLARKPRADFQELEAKSAAPPVRSLFSRLLH